MIRHLTWALFWLVVAALLLLGPLVHFSPSRIGLVDKPFVGCLALFMALYNAVRWWSVRSEIPTRGWEIQQRKKQEARHARLGPRPENEPDPNFDFGPPARQPRPPRPE